MMKPMKNKWGLFSAICLLVVVALGCEKEPEAPAKPKVVVKKINVAPKAPAETAKKPKAQPPAVAQKAPAPPPKKAPAPTPTSPPTKATVDSKAQAAPATTPVTDTVAAAPAVAPAPAVSETQGPAETETASGISSLAAMATTRIYNPEGRINPFMPLFQKEEKKEEETKERKGRQREHRTPQTPLEKVDLAQLKLVAIMQMQSGPRALVEESTGKGYVVRKGTYMGLHSGQVIDISGDRVIVEEEVENLLGDFEIKKRELKLQKPLGE